MANISWRWLGQRTWLAKALCEPARMDRNDIDNNHDICYNQSNTIELSCCFLIWERLYRLLGAQARRREIYYGKYQGSCQKQTQCEDL